MAIHVGHQLLFAALILLLQLCISPTEARPKEPENDGDGMNKAQGDGDDDDDSSSEETVEDSDDGRGLRRRRRDASQMAERGIPGLPDPATIIKLAQLFQSVGEQIVPILLEAILPASDPSGERRARDLQLLKNFKRTLEVYSDELQQHAM
ncbi:antennal-specific protein OS-C [Drosophila montana]|uniref:antennal-specific protein OS-C n=1 Tax=Drosophila montana TaxID=40370 RepID=UPI00313E751C